MSFSDRPIFFDCDGDSLLGILTVPKARVSKTGVLIIVGGPQYRIGSHRQFVLLSRALAADGIPSLRFDYRGMGDSEGSARTFDSVEADIDVAIGTFVANCPSVRTVILWGLCDAASAACLYARRDARVSGLILLNPWVRTDAGVAETYLKQYYSRRLFESSFWHKLFTGSISVTGAITDLLRALRLILKRQTREGGAGSETDDLPARMGDALGRARLPLLLILSGKDYVAKEFDIAVAKSAVWRSIVAEADVERLGSADHTFSRQTWRDTVASATARWVAGLESRRGT